MKTLITGYNSDVGQALAKRRLLLGDEVIVTSSTSSKNESSLNIRLVKFDLANPENSTDLEQIIDTGIDVLILNAAGKTDHLQKPFHELNFSEIQSYLRANIDGNIWLVQKVLPKMIEKNFGRILFISSITAQAGTSNYSTYSASKSAIEGLIFNLAVDYASYGIFSNILRPGVLATARTKEFWSRPGYQKIMGKIIPAGKIGLPEQVAEATDPLLSPTSYINGSVLEVSGGLPRSKSGLTL